MIRALFIAVGVAAVCEPANAGPHPNSVSVAAGHRIAIDVCSACHVVAEHQPEPVLTQKIPTFQEIADDPKATRRSLRHFITTTHWDEQTLPMTMPRQALIDPSTDDVVSYILSLRAAAARK